jgi:HEAT repeat protein
MFACINPGQVIQFYMDELKESDDPVQRLSALVVITFSESKGYMDDEIIEAIAKSLKSDPSPDVRRHAAWSLGFLNQVQSAEVLIQALNDEDCGVRLEVVNSLDLIGSEDDEDDDPNPKIVAGLLQALGDHSLIVRMKALKGLMFIDDKIVKNEIDKMIIQCEDTNPVLKE